MYAIVTSARSINRSSYIPTYYYTHENARLNTPVVNSRLVFATLTHPVRQGRVASPAPVFYLAPFPAIHPPSNHRSASATQPNRERREADGRLKTSLMPAMQNTNMCMSEVTTRPLDPSPCSLHHCGNHLIQHPAHSANESHRRKKETEKRETSACCCLQLVLQSHRWFACVYIGGSSGASRTYPVPPCAHSRDPTGKCAASLYPTCSSLACSLEPILA